MKMGIGISATKGLTSLRLEEQPHGSYLSYAEQENNSFCRDSWTVTADIKNKTLHVQRPKVGKCPAIAETFALQDGTLYLKSKQKVAEAKFVPNDLSIRIWEKYGIHEICCADPNRTYPARFRENPDTQEEDGAFQLVWTHTDGEVSTVERKHEEYTEDVVRYGRLDCFVGNVYGLYADKEVKHNVKTDKHPITMLEATKAFNNDDIKALNVSDANFAVVFALDPTYQLFNYLCVLYTTEKDHRKIMEMLDQKLASDKLLNIRGFNLSDLAHDYWSR